MTTGKKDYNKNKHVNKIEYLPGIYSVLDVWYVAGVAGNFSSKKEAKKARERWIWESRFNDPGTR